MWPTRFDGRKPYPNIVSIAQVQVFNNHSWDLWTQMWHAQLQSVDNGTADDLRRPGELTFAAWPQQMRSSMADIDQVPQLSADEYTALVDFLIAIEPLAAMMLRH